MSPQDKLKKFKEELTIARKAALLTKSLIEKRDKLDDQLTIIISQLEQDIFEHHRQETSSLDLTHQLTSKKAFVNELKKRKQEIDEKLDEYEGFSADVSEKLRGAVISAILECHPSEEETHKKMTESLKNNAVNQEKIRTLLASLTNVAHHLNSIIQERASVKRRSLFSFLFGRNPRVTISASFQAAEKAAQTSLAIIEHQGGTNGNTLYSDISTTLKAFLATAKKRWGFKSIDSVIHPLYAHFNDLVDSLRNILQRYQEEYAALEQEIEDWIERLTE